MSISHMTTMFNVRNRLGEPHLLLQDYDKWGRREVEGLEPYKTKLNQLRKDI